MKNTVKKLIEEIKILENNKTPENTLPQNTYYLGNEKILALPRKYGESRFPYDSDGFVVWASQTGYISACDSTFQIFRNCYYGEEAPVAFFGGVKQADGTYMPYSIMGNSRTYEDDSVKRYVVFALRSVYYIVDTEEFTFAVRMNVSKDKDINFAVTAENKTEGKKEIYLATFAEALLRFMETESVWEKMSKFAKRHSDSCNILYSRNGKDDCLVVNTKITEGKPSKKYQTVARSVFTGYRGRNIANAESLRLGAFDKDINAVNTTDLPVSSDIIHFELEGGEMCRIDVQMSVRHGMDEALKIAGRPVDTEANEAELAAWEKADCEIFDKMKITLDSWDSEKINPTVFNKFCRNIQKQVSFCALGKNYAGPHIGIRDVFQQLEGSLMWDKEKSREKILVAMNYIMSNGRAPRQFSVPHDPTVVPEFDLRMYIDQGVWIISTIYTYIAFTGDCSILDEECGYFDLLNEYTVKHSERRDSVLEHLVNICDFLASKLDIGNTWCMRALYGDWNDALDGLGRTTDEGKDYGDGVSVMTTLQYYQNLDEMQKLFALHGTHSEKAEEYKKLREKVEEGLFKYALEYNSEGTPRVIHGWGDKMSYKVGSYNDCDGKNRHSLTTNAYWAISGIMKKNPAIKESLMKCVEAVDSKYGLMTFSEAFAPETRSQIGRLATIVEGTAENRCAYIHASMFAIWALFLVGESERAWREMEKSIVITHDNCSMTSFVMPNSWCRNEELNIDGESMGDWYTGSGAVFIKELVRYGFGINPDLDNLVIQTPAYMPAKNAKIEIEIKGHPIKVSYKNTGAGERKFLVNGVETNGEYCELMNTKILTIKGEDITDNMTVEVID